MTKKIKILVTVIVLVILSVLFVPIPKGVVEVGGTREYVALTYRLVHWYRVTADGVYEKMRIYSFADRQTSLQELWEREIPFVEHRLLARVVECDDTTVVVEPLENQIERLIGEQLSFDVASLDRLTVAENDVVEVVYCGDVSQKGSMPSVDAVSWEIVDLRETTYTDVWLDKTTAEKRNDDYFSDSIITAIYADCFFARPITPSPYVIKMNGTLSDDWCVGDQIKTTQKNVYFDVETQRLEADLLTIEISDYVPDSYLCAKPVIYLYPTEETKVDVTLDLQGELTCTYPSYQHGWTVTASPDGTLTDETGQTYNYLYWEGDTDTPFDMSKGFCVKGEDTAAFLETALQKLGLTRREANEFIVYWLPMMQDNAYNVISFQEKTYTDAAALNVSPTPDTVIRVFMAWQASDTFVDLEEQELTAPAREGFTVVEWGGTEMT